MPLQKTSVPPELSPTFFGSVAESAMVAAPSPQDELVCITGVAGPKLIGIARMAADSEGIEEHKDVEYRTLASRSILTRCSAGERMPFTWTVNPYRGCEFACKYCFARYTHEFMEMRDGRDFERKIFIKQHTADLLRRELRKVKPGEGIAVGTATDPYQPAERRHGMTRALFEEFALHRGLSIGVVTKSNLILRDLELLRRVTEHNDLAINMTVTTTDTGLARLLEPRAPRPDLRLQAVRQLSDAGINAGIICAPVLPGITDTAVSVEAVMRAAAKAHARFVYPNPLFLKPCSEKIFMPFLEEKFPHLVAGYRERYKKNAYVSAAYRARVVDLFERMCRKHGLPTQAQRRMQRSMSAPKPDQLRLFA